MTARFAALSFYFLKSVSAVPASVSIAIRTILKQYVKYNICRVQSIEVDAAEVSTLHTNKKFGNPPFLD